MSTTSLSPLEVANARLLALRANFAADKKLSAPFSSAAMQRGLENDTAEQENRVAEQEIRVTPQENGAAVQESDSAEQEHDITAHGSDIADLCNTLPSHLGWGSETITAHLRRQRGVSAEPVTAAKAATEVVAEAVTITATENSEATPNTPAIKAEAITPMPPPAPATIKLYPDIALALLRTERVADGRLWLLLRALDENGRGYWTRQAAYKKLTSDDAPYRFCGERQLRKLLERGEGLFWHQDEQKRIWLHSQAKVAAALDIGRIQHKPVALPLLILCQPIGDVRAHLYASFHSTRSGGEKTSMPISRQQLTVLSGVCSRTQQTYDSRAAVEAKTCIAVGREESPVRSRVESATSAQLRTGVDPQEEAWKNGRAGFSLKDHRGQQGERGKVYHARRLPNSYRGPHAASGHGCRRLNRQLTDLRQKGAGNGQWTQSDGKRPLRHSSVQAFVGRSSQDGSAWTRRYAANGSEGGKVWAKENGRHLIYWRGRTGKRGIIIWYTLPSVES